MAVDASKAWTTAINACFARRLRPEEVDDAFASLYSTEKIGGKDLTSIVLLTTTRSGTTCDPLLPAFFNHFINAQYLTPADLLAHLFDTQCDPSNDKDDGARYPLPRYSRSYQEAIFTLLCTRYTNPDFSRSIEDSASTFRTILACIKAFNTQDSLAQLESDGMQAQSAETIAAYEDFATLVVVFLSNANVKKHLFKAIPKSAKPSILSILSQFSSTLSQWPTSNIYPKLQFLLKIPPMTVSDELNLDFDDLSADVVDLDLSRSRAGLYVYFNAALVARPLVDDLHLMSFLQARYPNDEQSLIGDLVVAAFDALANALHSRESPHMILCHRSLIANKLHGFITSLSLNNMYQPALTEQYIQMAIGRVETHPFPPLSSDSVGINDSIRDARQDFINACFTHHAIMESTAMAALGQAPLKPAGIIHNRQDLMQQMLIQPQRSEQLVAELDRMDGHAGTISLAIGDVLRQAVASKETSAIKTLSAALLRRLPLVDIVLQHCRLTDLLQHLCSYLDNWTQDEDQSELQPAYEDFAVIFLLVMALVHRFDVQVVELETLDRDGFIVKMLLRGSASRLLKDLSDSEKEILSRWVKGLFAVDDRGESTGIRDDIMAGCSPQTFYLLVPTLFEQIVLGCKHKALSPSTLRGGLEFLLEPFLLPSLIGGLGWLANHVFTNTKDTEIALQIMQRLLKPGSISGDAEMMHQAILGIMYKKVRPCLQEMDKRIPNRKDTSQLVAVLKPHADSQHETFGTISEIRAWAESPGTMKRMLAGLVAQLTTWTTQSDLNPIPTNYSHRAVATAIDRLGAEQVLQTIIAEVSLQTTIGLGPAALEVATCLICAPTISTTAYTPASTGMHPRNPTGRLTLRQALKLKLDDVTFLLAQHHPRTETLIRLGRLVDAQSATTIQPLLATGLAPVDLLDGISAATAAADGLGMAEQAAAVAVLDAAGVDFAAAMDTDLDLGGGGDDVALDLGAAAGLGMELDDDGLFGGAADVDFDLGLDVAGADGRGGQGQVGQGQALVSNDDDIFAGIDLGLMGDDDFGF